MHTFKPDQPVTIKEWAKPIIPSPDVDYKNFLSNNTDFYIYSYLNEEMFKVAGKQTHDCYYFSPSDLTPKSEVFKVKITIGKPGAWYVKLAGEIINVYKDDYYPHQYRVYGETFKDYNIDKSDCEIVTDEKFNINDPVLSDDGRKGVVKDYYSEGKVPVCVKWQDGSESWCTEEMLRLDRPTSLPFTEELFNQGKYSIHYDDMPVDGFHSFEGMYLGKIGSDWKQLNEERITLREKEVVVYFNIDSTGATGAKFKSIQDCKDNKDSIDLAVIAFNMNTRKSETVFDYLTDKK